MMTSKRVYAILKRGAVNLNRLAALFIIVKNNKVVGLFLLAVLPPVMMNLSKASVEY
ncbi:hypothetical protein ACOJQI_14885 [Bacillus salacetis]|uniref:hypothetical protein n=1 Tax=Bacillus salacetis TaxID=2315464 RepID=UPI003BA38763